MSKIKVVKVSKELFDDQSVTDYLDEIFGGISKEKKSDDKSSKTARKCTCDECCSKSSKVDDEEDEVEIIKAHIEIPCDSLREKKLLEKSIGVGIPIDASDILNLIGMKLKTTEQIMDILSIMSDRGEFDE